MNSRESSRSAARTTDARCSARAARIAEVAGGGTARSGRSRSSSVSAASLRSANQLVRVGVGAVDAVSAAPSVPGVGVIAYEISDLGCTALRTPVKMGAWLTIRRSAMSIQGGRKLRMEITR